MPLEMFKAPEAGRAIMTLEELRLLFASGLGSHFAAIHLHQCR
jgi:hypothetical protein